MSNRSEILENANRHIIHIITYYVDNTAICEN